LNANEFFKGTPFKAAEDIEIFLDMDGVLADFDAAAKAALKTDNTYKWQFIYGKEKFWEVLNKNPDFFLNLPVMPGATKLLWGLRKKKLAVLTALPDTSRDRTVDSQKRTWIARNIGSGIPVFTCSTEDKPKFCTPGAVLIDDRAVNKEAWEAAGGRYIIHANATDTLNQLSLLGEI
jgi:hypothetical protein